jgi:tRNA-splicing ligase RtcB
MDHDVSEAIDRLRRAPDVQQIAVMPDVHLSADVCIGVVVATSHLIYPQAVGGDIGCGMLAVGMDVDAGALEVPRVAGQVLADIGRVVPARRRSRRAIIPQSGDVASDTLSHASLESVRRNEGAIEFATLGSGNHFIELQSDEDGRLWLMVHSGSRVLGQTIYDHHLARAQPAESRLRVLDARTVAGVEYLHDASCARRFAEASRRAMAEQVGGVLTRRLGAHICWETAITTDTTTYQSNTTVGAISGCTERAPCRPGLARAAFCPDQWAVSASMWRDGVTRRHCVRVPTVQAGR